MKFYLRDKNAELVNEWRSFFAKEEDFEISVGDIFDGPKADAIVSPSNSFAIMDGGIDAVYIKKFGQQLEDRLINHVSKSFYGELVVGQATIIPTNDNDYPYLISSPTMRVPGSVKGTPNAYLAFRAVLILLKEIKIDSVLCPGLGTAIGQLSPFICAKQMYEAYKAIWLEKPLCPKSCAEAYVHQQSLIGWK